MVKYALTYFPVRNLAEPIRMTFHLHGQKFEDIRIKQEDWPKLKPTMPYNKLPMLMIDDKTMIVESQAILRFVGRKFSEYNFWMSMECAVAELAGNSNVWDEARVDEMLDLCADVRNAIQPYMYVAAGYGSGDLNELRRTALLPAAERYFPIYSRLLQENKSGYLVGSRPTIADLQLADFLFTIRSVAPELFDNHLDLSSYIDRIFTLPRLKNYIAQRPATQF